MAQPMIRPPDPLVEHSLDGIDGTASDLMSPSEPALIGKSKPMWIGAVIGAVGGIIGGAINKPKAPSTQGLSEANKYAADKEYAAAMEALRLHREQYQQGRADAAPWRDAGAWALNTMISGIQGGEFTVGSGPRMPGMTQHAGGGGTAALEPQEQAGGWYIGSPRGGPEQSGFALREGEQLPDGTAQAVKDRFGNTPGTYPVDPLSGRILSGPLGSLSDGRQGGTGATASGGPPRQSAGGRPEWVSALEQELEQARADASGYRGERQHLGARGQERQTPRARELAARVQSLEQQLAMANRMHPVDGAPAPQAQPLRAQPEQPSLPALRGEQPGVSGGTVNNPGIRRNSVAARGNIPTVEMPDLPDIPKPWEGFSEADMQADPGYRFRLREGTKAISRRAAAMGMSGSGATLKALQRYGQELGAEEFTAARGRALQDYGVGADEYNRAYARAVDDYGRRFADHRYQQSVRDSNYNRLAGIAGVGQTTVAQGNALGAQSAAAQGNALMQGASAQGSGAIGAQNAILAGQMAQNQARQQGWANMLAGAQAGMNIGSEIENWF